MFIGLCLSFLCIEDKFECLMLGINNIEGKVCMYLCVCMHGNPGH